MSDRLKRLLVVLMVLGCFVSPAHAKPKETWVQNAWAYIQAHPVHALCYGALSAGLAYYVWRVMQPNHPAAGMLLAAGAAAPALGGGGAGGGGGGWAHGLHAGADHSAAHVMDDGIASAIRASNYEASLARTLEVDASTLELYRAIQREVRAQATLEEKVLVIKRALMNFSHVFVRHERVLAAAVGMVLDEEEALQNLMIAIQEGFTLLQLAPELGVLDPEQDGTFLGLDTWIEQYRQLQLQVAAGTRFATLARTLPSMRHPLDNAVLILLARYVCARDGQSLPVALTSQELSRIELILVELFDMPFVMPPVAVLPPSHLAGSAAAAAAALEPDSASKVDTPDVETRRRRALEAAQRRAGGGQ